MKKEESEATLYSSVDRKLSSNFVNNKGRLPIPITGKYRIVSHYGQYNVEGLKNVRLDNKGINILGSPGAQARAIFDGEVTAVANVAGTNMVLVRHGSYISVYCNLSSVLVHRGQRVSTRQAQLVPTIFFSSSFAVRPRSLILKCGWGADVSFGRERSADGCPVEKSDVGVYRVVDFRDADKLVGTVRAR